MPTLFLLRHAKSSWADESQRDFDRPLANRGLKAAPRIGAYMRDNRLRPNFILCSTSRRTRETLGLILPFLEGESRILMEDGIYDMTAASDLLDRLRHLPKTASRVLVIGHNPILHDTALALVESAMDPIQGAMLEEKFPTGALAAIDMKDTPWPALAPHTGVLNDYVIPRELDRDET
ncbi:histidine phosphatase family protein [Rhodospirillaceae bacterium KN72]|uniref:Histidine phosphatase family protein n=1 Tax=Pacificispira spongiicola TaxID=2729598 RepID=A0A7Y0E2N7_9PROT|nr:histidine phosphatase family protein [Pacificispira spongiicola]NMM46125.1 histidine phosphatase family protein [Pacificispira spongiicola]